MYIVYMRAAAEQYNYKMYRPRSTYLAAATTTSSTPDYSTEMNGARGVRATSSHHWSAAVVCKMEITSREYYSFCVISSMI